MPLKQQEQSPEPLEQLALISERHDSKVRLLFQLENYISLVKYDPVVAKRDKTAEFRRFLASKTINIWDTLNKKSDTRKTFKRLQRTRKQVEDLQVELRKRTNETAKPKEPNRKIQTPSTISKRKPTIDNHKLQKESGRSVKRRPASNLHTESPGSQRESDSSSGEGYLWHIDSDLCWPDQPLNTKRMKHTNLITHPSHYVKPQFNKDLDKLLSNYKTLTDDHESINSEQWSKKVETEAESLLRVHIARKSGLLAELELNGVGSNKQIPTFVPPPPPEPSHYDNMISQVVHYSKLRSNLRKFHQSITKRNAQSVEQYFRRLVGAEDREKKELERQVRQVARKTGQEVLKKWKLAQKIVDQRREAILAEEKREKGKEYLNQILDNSAKLIESRIGDGNPNESFSDETDENNGGSSSDNDRESGVGKETPNDNDDADLPLDQLREKYRNMPNLSMSEADDDGSDIDSDNNELHNDDDDDDEEEVYEHDDDKPSEEALRLYAEINEGADEESESELESDSGSDSGSEVQSDSEVESEEEKKPGLNALFGNFVEDADDEDAKVTDGSSESDNEHLDNTVTSIGPEIQHKEENCDHENNNKKDLISKDGETLKNGIQKANSNDISQPEVQDFEQSNNTKVEDADSASEISNNHKIKPPFLLKGELREYQRNGLDWLAGLVESGTNGILADEMGLGKTIQTIGLLAWLACERQVWGPHLIVVPTSVMLNWEMEFKRFAPGFKILTYFGTPQQRKRKRRGWNKEDTWHVCITSYQLVIQDQVVFRGKKWQFMVLDEAHNIKNFRSQRWQALLNFNAQHRLLLTGTPLQNNLVELWSLLYFLMPSTRATQMMPAGFASLDDFQEWFAKPVDQMVEEGEQADDEARKTIAKLHQVLRPYLLRRLKIDVEKQMPAKYEHIVYCRLSKRQRYLYDDFMSRASTRATLESGNFMSILNCLMQLRKVCNHPDLFEVRPIVTSHAIDCGVYNSYCANIVPRFTIAGVNRLTNFGTANLLFTHFESEPKITGLSRLEINANKLIESEIKQLKMDISEVDDIIPDYTSVEAWAKYSIYCRRRERIAIREQMLRLNRARTSCVPLYGNALINQLVVVKQPIKGFKSYLEREETVKSIIERYAFVTPPVVILDYPQKLLGEMISERIYSSAEDAVAIRNQRLFHEAQVRLSIAFPDKRLLQYDCGKLQKLAILLRDLISNGHRCLIFTQMTKVLDILEQFMNLHGWRYLRLDGATRIEQRQALTERFNKDASIPVFILSTRSGGLGINLTGADTVIFYDSDWNPAMDRQCQDRCHRIGQTRDVHIYRLVSEFTIESNILRKATQKTILDNVVIQEGDFTTEYFSRMSVQDILGDDVGPKSAAPTLEQLDSSGPKRLEVAMAQAEDRDDQLAANLALSEAQMDQEEFADVRQQVSASWTPEPENVHDGNYIASSATSQLASPKPSTPGPSESTYQTESNDGTGYGSDDQDEPDIGHIDDWMIRAIERGDIY